MAENDQNSDVDFMMRRCLGISLSDGKEALRASRNVNFDIVHRDEAFSSIHFQPILLLSRYVRIAASFSKDLLPILRGWAATSTNRMDSGRIGRIDWEKTSAGRSRGNRKPIVEVRPRCSFVDLAIAEIVATEFLIRAKAVADLITPLLPDVSHVVAGMLQLLIRRLEVIDQTWQTLGRNFPRHQERNAFVANVERWCAALQAGDVPADLKSIEEELERFLERIASRGRRSTALLRWRSVQFDLDMGCGPGRRFSLAQSRTAPGLFELWCFVELVDVLWQRGQVELVQCSVLRNSTRSMFKSLSGVEVFYDFHGLPHVLPMSSTLLKRAHVEWFIRNPKDIRKSVIVDTKYKNPESKDYLTTLGYMTNFQIERGAVIFRHDLDLGAFHARTADRRFAVCDLGLHRFCLMALVPRQSELERNHEALGQFIDEILIE